MKIFSCLIAIDETIEIQKAIDILKENGIECEDTSCYIATLKEEISQTLTSYGFNPSEQNINKVLSYLEEQNDMWDSLESRVQETISMHNDWEKEESNE